MTGYDGRGTRFPLTIARGADMAFQLTVVDSNSAAVDVSTATIAGNIYTKAGTLVDTMSAAVSGAGNNIITLSFTDTETALFTSSGYQWSLLVTRGGDLRPWLAGPVNVVDPAVGGQSTTGDTTLTVDGDLAVTVTVNAIGGSGGTVRVEDEGVSVVAAATALNFTGTGVTVTDAGSGEATVSISSGGSGANLAWVAASSTVTSDTGTDATLTAVDGSNPGLMTVAMKTKLDGIEAGADVTDAANVAAAGAVMDTGNETIAGIKTFSSDPLIPDEAYGAGWNGSLEPPTKNAVYDKIETLGGGGAIRVEDEGVSTVAAAVAINFAGAGVAVTDAGSNEALVTISGGGSSDPLDGNSIIISRVFSR